MYAVITVCKDLTLHISQILKEGESLATIIYFYYYFLIHNQELLSCHKTIF